MSKISYVCLDTDGLGDRAQRVVRAALTIAQSNRGVQLHYLSIADFYECTDFPTSTSTAELRKFFSEVINAQGRLDEFEIIDSDEEFDVDTRKCLGKWPIFKKIFVSRERITFEMDDFYQREICASLIRGSPFPVRLWPSERDMLL